MKHAIPEAVLKKHTAIFGMTGSGKSSTSKLMVEQVVESGSRVCILDPTKSDHWGLTSSKSGKGAGLPFQILGGPHGHVPLHDGAGKAIAEVVASGELPLSIIDMADFGPGGLQKFFNDFAPTLMRKMRGVLYLLIEEAHEFAPKEKSEVRGESMAIYYTKKLATASRSKGVRLIVCSQRVQALHNAVIGSCETLIVHRMTAPADQDPVTKWLKGAVKDKELRQQIEDSMPGLADGEGWICSGSAKILTRIQFPRIHTFDNSATPEDDKHRVDVVQAKVDVEKLRGLIGMAIAEATANDPATLKRQIADLQRQLAAAAAKPAGASKEELQASFTRGLNQGQQQGIKIVQDAATECIATARRFIHEAINANLNGILAPLSSKIKMPTITVHSKGDKRAAELLAPALVKAAREAAPHTLKRAEAMKHGDMPPIVRKIIDQFHRAYPVSLSFASAAMRAGVSNKSSAYRKYMVSVAQSHELEAMDGKYRSRPQFAAAGPISAADGVSQWVDKLPASYGKMLTAIHEHGPIDKLEIAERAGVSQTSSGLISGLRELRSLSLIVETEGRYEVAEGLR